MAYLNKEFKYVKHERYDELLKTMGLTDDKIQGYVKIEGSEKITKDGDVYTIHYKDHEGNMEIKFKPGVEFEEPFDDGVYAKSTCTFDGNVIHQVLKVNGSTINAKKEYNGNDLVVTMTSDKWDGVAKTYYKA